MANWILPLAILCVMLTATMSPCMGQKETITVTDLRGKDVTLDVPAENIVLQWSGAGGALLTLFALEGKDAPKKIAAMDTTLKINRMDIWEKFTEAFPEMKDIPEVGDTVDLSTEKVISLKPDAVVVPLNGYNQAPDIYKILEDASIPVVVIDYHSETLENHTKSILLMGKLLGKEERAQKLADYYAQEMDKVNLRLKEISKKSPTVYVECGSQGPSEYGNSYGRGYMWGGLIDTCRGTNIAEGAVAAGKAAAINPEFLLTRNPDIVIITGAYWPAAADSMRLGYNTTLEGSLESLKTFTKRPGWDTLDAVKNNRVYGISHVLSRDIWDFVGNQYFAKLFYSEEFNDLDPEENLKAFYKEFMPLDYSGVWMISLEE